MNEIQYSIVQWKLSKGHLNGKSLGNPFYMIIAPNKIISCMPQDRISPWVLYTIVFHNRKLLHTVSVEQKRRKGKYCREKSVLGNCYALSLM